MRLSPLMRAWLRHFRQTVGDTFWLLPGFMVVAGILLALGLVAVDRQGLVPQWLINSPWLYSGSGTGARTLLGAVASSTIGVAGTVFSITIASLSLAAGQMGPRLLRNFVQDRGNQFTLGAFLGTFCYALMVLRSVRTEGEGPFVPYLSLSVGIGFAFLCVGTLVFFVGHIAGRINVDTVVELVSGDVSRAIQRLTLAAPPPAPHQDRLDWSGAERVGDMRRGYLQQLDEEALTSWAINNGRAVRLLVRPGGYVFPGATIAEVRGGTEGAAEAIRKSTVVGPERVSDADLEFAVRQLVEVAVRALAGANDPHTAVSVLDRLGAALCDVAPRYLPDGVWARNGQLGLVVPVVTYDGLVDTMFHEIRQHAAGSPAVLVRMLEIMTAALDVERQPERVQSVHRHAGLVLADAERDVANQDDLADIRLRYQTLIEVSGLAARDVR